MNAGGTTATGVRGRWRSTRRVWKVLIGVVVLFVAINVGVFVLGSFARVPSGPGESSYSTSIDGYQAWYELLASFDRSPSRIGGALDEAELNPDHTLIIADGFRTLDAREVDAVRIFVNRGGRLVAISETPGWLTDIIGVPVAWSGNGTTPQQPLVTNATTAGITTITGDGVGSWRTLPPQSRPLFGGVSTIGTAEVAVGRGVVVLVADRSPLQNQYLAASDNALYALRITGRDRPVDFAEGVHGFGEAEGFSAIPTPWKLFAIGVLLAGLILLVAKARRLGPPEETVRRSAPPRKLYVDALAQALARTRSPGGSAQRVQDAVRRIVARRSGTPMTASDEAFLHAGARLGVPDEEMRAALEPVHSDEQLVLATRALARLTDEGGTP